MTSFINYKRCLEDLKKKTYFGLGSSRLYSTDDVENILAIVNYKDKKASLESVKDNDCRESLEKDFEEIAEMMAHQQAMKKRAAQKRASQQRLVKQLEQLQKLAKSYGNINCNKGDREYRECLKRHIKEKEKMRLYNQLNSSYSPDNKDYNDLCKKYYCYIKDGVKEYMKPPSFGPSKSFEEALRVGYHGTPCCTKMGCKDKNPSYFNC